MRGRPFRIAAAGLCAAFFGTVVAAVSHFGAETNAIAPLAVPLPPETPQLVSAPAPNAPVEPPASSEPVLEDPPLPAQDIDHPIADWPSLAIAELPLPPPSVTRIWEVPFPEGEPNEPPEPVRAITTQLRRPRLVVDLGLDATEELSEPSTDDARESAEPQMMAELTSLRRDLERMAEEDRTRRQEAAAAETQRAAEEQTSRMLADLRHSLDELRVENAIRHATETPEKSSHAEPSPDQTVEAEPPDVELVAPVDDAPAATVELDSVAAVSPIRIVPSQVEGCFDITIDSASLDAVLSALGTAGGWNIVVEAGVDGEITADWKAVTPQQALEALLKANGLVSERKSSFVMVSHARPSAAEEADDRQVLVQLYRPLYISGRDLLPIIQPLLTPGIGRAGVTLSHSSDDATAAQSGGNLLAQPDAVLVVDFPDVIEMVSRAISELDVPAPHVELEATIIDVELAGRLRRGVSELLETGALTASTECTAVAGGDDFSHQMCCQTCPEPSSQILERLRAWTKIRVVTTARLHVLNKQAAELCAGEAYVWREVAGSECDAGNREPLQDCTRLWVRPFVSADHLVRLEVAPQTASVLASSRDGARQSFTSVSTSVAVPNCGTLVIAGLNVEECVKSKSALFKPWRNLFGKGRKNTNEVHRRELVVMITPRIVHDATSAPAIKSSPLNTVQTAYGVE